MENENENFELDAEQAPAAGNKDLWLYLIIVDLIGLCVFGFFLYKNLSAQVFNAPKAEVPAVAVVAEETVAPVVAKAPAVKETPVKEAPAAPAPVKTVSLAEEPAEEPSSVLAQVLPVVQQAEQTQSAQQQQASAADQKQSVIVEENPKSKNYRRVTFRYFGDAKKVAVVSGFTMSKPQALKKKKGHWETTLSIAPGSYKFLFIVDGVNTLDPYSPQKDGRSLLEVK